LKDSKILKIINKLTIMIITTSEQVFGKTTKQALGLVKGNTIRAKHIGKDIIAGLRNLVGGEIKEYTEALNEAREEAIQRMIKNAEELEADAIVGVRFTTSQIMAGAAELLVYGTAIKLDE
jgi:uncharacterized protein YbjQ (UPF0145 family)